MRRSLAAFALLACAGCLPTRDNPRDPANAPDVRVRFLDITIDGAACPPVPGPTPTPTPVLVSAVSRGRCVMIDASATTDAGGDPITGSDAFDYTIEDTPPIAVTNTGARLLLSEEQRHALTPNEVLTVRVAATDSHGYRGEGSASIVFLNAPPAVRALPPRLLPVGGHPWAPGADIDVAFAAFPSDPDGERVRLCWTFPGESESCGELGDASPIVRPIAVDTRGRVVALVRAFDDEEHSPIAAEQVMVDLPALWAAGNNTDGPIFRFDGGATTLAIDDTGFPTVLDAAPSGDSYVVSYRKFESGFQDVLTGCAPPGPCPAGTPIGPGLGSQGGTVATTTSGAFVWTVNGTDALSFEVDDVGGGVLAFTPANAPVETSLPPYARVVAAVDAAESLWLATVREGLIGSVGHVEVVSKAGVVMVVATNDSLAITALERRPGTNEIWVATEAADGSDAPLAPGLRIWNANAPQLPPSIVELPFGASGLAFVDGTLAWVGLPNAGLALVDVTELAGSGDFERATIVIAEIDARPSNLIADPETGAVYAQGRDPDDGTFVSLTADRFGDLAIVPAFLLERPVAIAPDGRAVRAYGSFHITFAGGADELVERFFASRPFGRPLGYDPSTGGLWVPVVEPIGFERRAVDGSVLSLFTTAIVDGAEVPFPDLFPLAYSPGGDWLVGSGPSDELLRVALGESTPVITLLDPANASLVPQMRIAGPSAPDDRVWGISNDQEVAGYFDASAPLDLAVDFVPLFTSTTGLLNSPSIAVAQGSGDACFGFDTNTPGEARLYRFHADDSPARLLAAIPNGGLPFSVRALGGVSESDACWFLLGYQDDPSGHFRVLGYLADGTLIADEEVSGVGLAMDGVVLSDSRLWFFLRIDPAFDVPARLLRLDVLPGSPGSGTAAVLTPLDAALPPSNTSLVAP